MANNTTNGFIGDYSVGITNNVVNGATANNVTFINNIADGKNLTFSGDIANTGITDTRTLSIQGAGDTIVNGNITTSTAFNLNLQYLGQEWYFDPYGGGASSECRKRQHRRWSIDSRCEWCTADRCYRR